MFISENFGITPQLEIFSLSLTNSFERPLHISRILANIVYRLYIEGGKKQ